jgi:broad specificity phosphatase PhoE
MASRGRWFNGLGEHERRTQAQASWLYGEWLRSEAKQAALPTVECEPWQTLADRVLRLAGYPA